MLFLRQIWRKHFFKPRRVYFDYAAATPLDARVLRAMQYVNMDVFANPSSVHREGVRAKTLLRSARVRIARALRAREEEIIFTSGGTESNNLAIFGVVEALFREGRAYGDMHIITSSVEHVSILKPIAILEARGVAVTYLPVDEHGQISLENVVKALRKSTVLISLMYVNNEIGTITPLRKITSAVLKHYREDKKKTAREFPLFHTDASQAPLFLDCSPERLGVDLLTLDAQKLYGPKGVGLLYKKHGSTLAPILYGGAQEGSMRAGTESLALICGFAEALVIAEREHSSAQESVCLLRDSFIRNIEALIPQVIINGDRRERIANNVSITIPDCDMEFLVIKLDHAGIAASSASACLLETGSSYVMKALRGSDLRSTEAIRFTLGKETTKRDIECAVKALKRCVKV